MNVSSPIEGANAKTFVIDKFKLRSGVVMRGVEIAYRTRGKLAADGRNAVLVTHGYTSGPQMIDPAAGVGERARGARSSAREAGRYRPFLCRLPEHARLVLRVDQCGEHQSLDR